MAQSGFNIDTFKGNIFKTGILRDNKFEVLIEVPRFLVTQQASGLTATPFNTTSSELRFWCEAADIPGIQVATHEVRRYGYGPFERKPFNVTFTQSSMVILGDAGGRNWDLFQKWIQYIHNFDYARQGNNGGIGLGGLGVFETNYKGTAGDSYATNITVIVYDDAGKEKIKVKLIDAYPTFLGDIKLNWSNTNGFMRIPVTFTFFTWTNELTGNVSAPITAGT